MYRLIELRPAPAGRPAWPFDPGCRFSQQKLSHCRSGHLSQAGRVGFWARAASSGSRCAPSWRFSGLSPSHWSALSPLPLTGALSSVSYMTQVEGRRRSGREKIEVKDLRNFVAVAEDRNISRAAARLGMQQSPSLVRLNPFKTNWA